MKNGDARSIDGTVITRTKWRMATNHGDAGIIYFIHEGKVRAPAAAMALIEKLAS
jgi:hypothetical protein